MARKPVTIKLTEYYNIRIGERAELTSPIQGVVYEHLSPADTEKVMLAILERKRTSNWRWAKSSSALGGGRYVPGESMRLGCFEFSTNDVAKIEAAVDRNFEVCDA